MLPSATSLLLHAPLGSTFWDKRARQGGLVENPKESVQAENPRSLVCEVVRPENEELKECCQRITGGRRCAKWCDQKTKSSKSVCRRITGGCWCAKCCDLKSVSKRVTGGCWCPKCCGQKMKISTGGVEGDGAGGGSVRNCEVVASESGGAVTNAVTAGTSEDQA